ncbi:MAG: FAD-dependent oxidoreductase [Eubacteriales bacterium]|nr:FAD-dependent oxidoreductase [Eubacteriales bacterium]
MSAVFYDIVIAGGSLGGVQAARAAAESGMRVFLCEQTAWVGGQLSSQAVPPDEHIWIEQTGATASYRQYREQVRQYYRSLPTASEQMRKRDVFCPGSSWVSRVAHEPAVAHRLLMESLKPWIDSGSLTLRLRTRVLSAKTEGSRVHALLVQDMESGEQLQVEGRYFLDATDCGDLLPLTGTEYRTGAESIGQTGEPHAAQVPDPGDMQPATWVAALELDPDDARQWRIPKPAFYDEFQALGVPYDDNRLLSWYAPNAKTGRKERFAMFDGELPDHPLGLWSYRRIIDPANYSTPCREVTLLNWPQNDYSLGNLYDSPEAPLHRALARQLTLCAVYWLQNHAPRADGGTGYRVALRPDITGTPDGLAMAPYIRESRRIVAMETVREQDISRDLRDRPPYYADSVGVGHYAVDVHMTTRSHTFLYAPAWPFEIPLGAMIPVRMENLLPACKNIGCTHLTNGCYRLHPVEWNIGEVAGYLASYCIRRGVTPLAVWKEHCADFQRLLTGKGIQLHWDAAILKGL